MNSIAAHKIMAMAAQTCVKCNENDILHCDDICCDCGVNAYYHRIGVC
jgi:hypothetical protein